MPTVKACADSRPHDSHSYRERKRKHSGGGLFQCPGVPFSTFRTRCLAHLEDEPCPVCAGYIAAGL